MKGKIAFVLGAGVGYVLGSRAGRERYEQIKRSAEKLWNTEPVQRGAGALRGAAQGKVDDLKDTVIRAGKDAFTAFTRATSESRSGSASDAPGASADRRARRAAEPPAEGSPVTPVSGATGTSAAASEPGSKPGPGSKPDRKRSGTPGGTA